MTAEEPKTPDALLAETLLREGALRSEQLDAAIKTQHDLRRRGMTVPLGELLVREGHLKLEDLPIVLHCASCGKNYRVRNWSLGKTIFCPTCSTALVAPSADSSIDASRATVPAGPVAQDLEGVPFGRYRLLKELGRGGMGVVWKAWDSQLKRAVALKQIIGEEDLEQIERFMREARAAAALRHPNIVPIHDVGVESGKHFFTMDFIEGMSLKENHPSTREALEIVRDVARALSYAHEQGIIHRDVKPANILLDAKGTPYVTDFGLAKDIKQALGSGTTMSGVVLGTPSYMSPEQARGRMSDVGPASDQFSLGVTLYELLMGTLPFTGDGINEIMNAIIDRDPPRLAGIHRDIETICLKGLEKVPTKRYANLKDFADDLARYLDGEPIAARPVSGLERLWRKGVKHRVIVVPVAAALLVAAGVGVWALVNSGIKEKEKQAALAKAAHEEGGRKLSEAALEAERVADKVKSLDKYLYSTTLPMEEYWKAIDECEREFDALCENHPDVPEVWYLRGRMHLMLSNYEKAGPDLTKALELDPKHYLARLYRARLYSEWQISLLYAGYSRSPEERKRLSYEAREKARADLRILKAAGNAHKDGAEEERTHVLVEAGEAIADGNYAAAVESLNRTNEESPHEEYFALLGLALPSVSDPAKVESAYAEALRRRPRFWKALFDRGIHKIAKGDLNGAIADFDEALKINPRYLAAFNNRASARETKGDFDGAIADCDEALKIDPTYEAAYYNRAHARADKGDLEGAIADCDKALKINPRYLGALACRGEARKAKGDLDGAIADYDDMLKIEPRWAEALSNRGVARADKGDIEGAIADYDEALKINPRFAPALENRGNARKDKGDFAGAIADYDESLKFNPRNAEALNNRGVARQAAGDQAAAISDFDESLKINPRNAEAIVNRGLARAKKGDLAGAIADYDEALRINPRLALAYYNRSIAREAKGDLGGSLEDLTKALDVAPQNWPYRKRVEAELETLRRKSDDF